MPWLTYSAERPKLLILESVDADKRQTYVS